MTSRPPSYVFEVYSQFQSSEKPSRLGRRAGTQTCTVKEIEIEESPLGRKSRHVIYPELTSSMMSGSSGTRSQESSSSRGQQTGFLAKMKTGVRGLLKKDSSEASTPRQRPAAYRAFLIDRVTRRSKNSGVEECETALDFIEEDLDDEWTLLDVAPAEPVRVEHPVSMLPLRTGFDLNIPYTEVRRFNRIGEGAFGSVYKAMYQGQLVALKEVDPRHYDIAAGECFINSLKSELCVMGALGNHDNVLQCYGGSLHRPHVFMLCQLMDTTLGDLLYRQSGGRNALSIELSLSLMHDILSGLKHLHEWTPQVVHRDLKPENILLDQNKRAYLADFGLSRTKSHSYLNTEHTHAGTPEYLAPEVLTGKVNEKMDIYAVGVIFWECFMAERPWEGYHPFVILSQVSQGSTLSLPEDIFPAGQPDGEVYPMYHVRNFIERCWESNPDKRPNCQELLDKIEAIQRLV